jgi:hypothetical protein
VLLHEHVPKIVEIKVEWFWSMDEYEYAYNILEILSFILIRNIVVKIYRL